jgi:hypothetical protein
MRNARKLLLLAVMAMTAMAFAAQTASAQTLEITNEANNAHCSAVTIVKHDVNNGCLIHANSEAAGVELRKHVFGVESHITKCKNEFHGRVDEDANGYIFEQVLSNLPVGPACTRAPCTEIEPGSGEGDPWAASGHEGSSQEPQEQTDPMEVENEYLTTNFCVKPVGGGSDEQCEIDVPFFHYEGEPEENHITEFGHANELSSHGFSGFRCELIGHWITETHGVHDGEAETEVHVAHI